MHEAALWADVPTMKCPDNPGGDRYQPVTECVVVQGFWAGPLSVVVRSIVGMSGAENPIAVAQGMAQLRESVAAAVAALKGISDVAFQLPSGEIGEVVAELGELVAFGNAGLVRMTAEAEQRGVVEASQSASTAGWLRDTV